MQSILMALLLFLCFACTEQMPLEHKRNNTNVDSRNQLSVTPQTPPGDPAAVFDAARMTNAILYYGGLLYDRWWLSSFQNPLPAPPAPDAVHPLYPTAANTMVGPDTFRCKECHGWDYLGVDGAYGEVTNTHYTGIPGIVNATNTYKYSTDAELWAFLHDGDATNNLADHAFGNDLSDDDVYNLTRFVLTVRDEATQQLGPASFIDLTKTVTADALNGSRLFRTNSALGGAGCADFRCHGPNGRFLPLAVPLGALAQTNPWEVLHKIRFGQPGAMMVGLVAQGNPNLGVQEAADILNYIKLALGANHVRGGRLYDDWPVESGMPNVASPNPLWDLADPALTGGVVPTGAEAWRCVNCHDYHYEGNIAFNYNNLLYLKAVREWTLEYVYRQLRFGFPAMFPDGTVQIVHEFASHLNDNDLWELSAFAVEGIVNTNKYLQPDLGTAVGDSIRPANPANGLAIYEGTSGATLNGGSFDCFTCHDPTVGTVPGIDVASLAWTSPWRFFHRVRFGVPRDPATPPDVVTMPGIQEAISIDGVNMLMMHDAIDVQRYLQESALGP